MCFIRVGFSVHMYVYVKFSVTSLHYEFVLIATNTLAMSLFTFSNTQLKKFSSGLAVATTYVVIRC